MNMCCYDVGWACCQRLICVSVAAQKEVLSSTLSWDFHGVLIIQVSRQYLPTVSSATLSTVQGQ